MFRNKYSIVTIFALVALAVLAACGGQPAVTAQPPTAAPQPTVPPVVSTPLPVRVPPALPGHRAMRDEAFAPPLAADPDYARETSDSLTSESLLHGKRAAPGSGWRRGVYRATGGLLR